MIRFRWPFTRVPEPVAPAQFPTHLASMPTPEELKAAAEAQRVATLQAEQWEKVKALYPVGRTFDYCGRRLTVTSWNGLVDRTICTEYTAKDGALLGRWFTGDELTGLIELAKTPEPVKEWWEDPWAGVKKNYPPGCQFPFQNSALIVMGYSYETDGAGVIHPVMLCGYRDSTGELHEWRFNEHHIDLLVAKTEVKK